MPFRMAMAVVVGVIALAFPVATAHHNDRNKNQMLKAAQYCMPDDEDPGAKSDLYCLM